MDKRKKKLECSDIKKFRLLLEIAVGIFLIALIFKKSGILLETNDEFFISHLLSGSIISDRQIRIFNYVHVFETVPLTILYRLLPSFPWYGAYILLCHLLLFAIPLNAITSRIDNLLIYLATVSIWCFIFLSQWYSHTRIQYTSTAELLALAGFVSFLFYKNRKLAFWIMLILETMAYSMRPNSMMLMLPTGFSIIILLFLYSDKDKRERIRECVLAIIVCFAIVIVGYLVTAVVNAPKKYRDALSANQARVTMFDYNTPPEYGKIKHILDEKDISKEKYMSLCFSYFVPNWDVSDGALEEIADYEKKTYAQYKPIKEVIKEVIETTFEYDFCNKAISKEIIAAFLTAIIATIVFLKPKYQLQLISYVFLRAVGLGYLFFIDRAPKHVLLPLLFADVIVTFCVVLSCVTDSAEKNDDSKKKNKTIYKYFKYAVILIPIAILCFYSYKSAQSQYRFISTKKDGMELLNESQAIINDYCDSHEENVYILSPRIYAYWPVDIIDTAYEEHNYMLGGGWYSLLPESQKTIHEYMNTDKTICVICVPYEDTPGNRYILEYLRELTGREDELMDHIDMPTGARIRVYAYKP